MRINRDVASPSAQKRSFDIVLLFNKSLGGRFRFSIFGRKEKNLFSFIFALFSCVFLVIFYFFSKDPIA